MDQKTKLQIIEETAEYYGANPSRRASNEMGCFYRTHDDKMCAVGRCMINAKRTYTGTCLGIYDGVLNDLGETVNHTRVQLEDLLKEEYRGHSDLFWREIQGFHDHDDYFTAYGLSDLGKERVANMKEKYAKN